MQNTQSFEHFQAQPSEYKIPPEFKYIILRVWNTSKSNLQNTEDIQSSEYSGFGILKDQQTEYIQN